jgi:hypothetical protein
MEGSMGGAWPLCGSSAWVRLDELRGRLLTVDLLMMMIAILCWGGCRVVAIHPMTMLWFCLTPDQGRSFGRVVLICEGL